MEWNETTYTEKQVSDMKREAENKIKEMHSKSKINGITNKNKCPRNSKTPNPCSNSPTKTATQHPSVNFRKQVRQNKKTPTSGNKKTSTDNKPTNIPKLHQSDILKIPIINKEVSKDTIIILAVIFTLINGQCDDNYIILALVYILLF